MIDKKLSIKKTANLLGKSFDVNNILDLVLEGELPLYVRACNFNYGSGSSGFPDKRLWSENKVDNTENIRSIRDAFNDKSQQFKVIMSDEQKKYSIQRCEIYLKEKQQKIEASELFPENQKYNIGGDEIVSIDEAFKHAELKLHNSFLKSRFNKQGKFTIIEKDNCIYSDSISTKDIYFLEKDVFTLKESIPNKKKIKKLESKIEQLKTQIVTPDFLDSKHEYYAPELKLAIDVWNYLYIEKKGAFKKSVKDTVHDYLTSNYSTKNNQSIGGLIDRISKVSSKNNPKKVELIKIKNRSLP